jgi:hypothetical protein
MALRRRTLLMGSAGLAAGVLLPGRPGAGQPAAQKGGIPADAASRSIGAAWSLDRFPELLMTGWFQQDAPEGPVRTLVARGMLPLVAKAAGDGSAGPVRAAAGGGVVFRENAGEHLAFDRVGDALASYRWGLIVFRIAGSTGTGKSLSLVTVNHDPRPGGHMPGVSFQKGVGIVVQWNGVIAGKGVTPFKLIARNLRDDGKTWNCLFFHRRHGRLFARLNGVDASGPTPSVLSFAAPRPEEVVTSRIGDPAAGGPAWAFDRILLGQSELSEATAAKIEADALWSLSRQDALPAGHPFRGSRPLVDQEDFPRRYRYDAAALKAWGDSLKSAPPGARMGRPRAVVEGFERVFYDDFRADSVGASAASPAEDRNWYGPGWNSAVGMDATMLSPDAALDVYEHDPSPPDPAVPGGGTIDLSLKFHGGGWKCGAIYSVNDAGQGRSWAGAKIFRARVKFPRYDTVPGGFFQGFWSYGLEALFWRTGERIEVDFWEADSRDGTYLNGGSSHVHKGMYPGRLGHLEQDAPRNKVFGGRMTGQATGLPAGLNFWDGQWHCWEFVVDDEETTFNVTVDKGAGEEWIELFRCRTPAEYRERLYLIFSQGLRKAFGEPDRDAKHSMLIGSVEVLQKTARLQSFTAPFTALPNLQGQAQVGEKLVCHAALPPSIIDVWYYWYADGYPRGYSPSPTYAVRPQDRGASIRCMVKAVGALGQPEAWTAPTDAVAG